MRAMHRFLNTVPFDLYELALFHLVVKHTGQQLRTWMRRQGWRIEPTMQLDNFDLIINLVSIGLGISFVPIRAMALYNQKQKLLRVPLPTRFTREWVVVVRKHRKLPAHIDQFIANVLF
jgi:DNA-binding transcriptional LysR family regulator